jgi:glycine oxidase
VIVAGAGIIGLASAWRLSRLGLRVTVFDARETGAEASWAGAGMLAPGGEFDKPSEMASVALRSLEEYPEFVRELKSETGCQIDFRQCGAFELAMNREESEALRRKAERQRRLGIESEACAWGGWDARFYPRDAIVDPRNVTAALRAACEKRGVVLREHEPVLELAPDGSWARTARETIADEDGVLVASGAWSSSLSPALPRTIPVRGHLVSWNAQPGMLPSIVRHGHTYLLQRGNGTIIAGSSTEHAGFERGIDLEIVAGIRRRAAALLGTLASMEPAACWNGFRPAIATADGEPGPPLIGRVESKLWAAFGHYRNGILLAPETARLVAGQMSGRNAALAIPLG